MGKGRFVNQKLGKRVSRKFELIKSHIAGQRPRTSATPAEQRWPKKGISREQKP